VQIPKEKSNQWKLVSHSKKQLLEWANRFEVFTYLNPNQIDYPNEPFSELLAIGTKQTIPVGDSTFQSLEQFHASEKCWLFGFLTYDLKNELENVKSENSDFLHFPKAYFYEPTYLFKFEKEQVWSWKLNEERIEYEIDSFQKNIESVPQILKPDTFPTSKARKKLSPIQARTSKKQYLEDVQSIRQHIEEGDVYELNYCMEFFAENYELNPWQVFEKLCTESPMPFACFQKIGEKHAICASPERFLKKTSNKLISQPIKGTVRRGKSAEEDEVLKKELFNSEKERAENMMIVDLVRNDLARTAKVGSVKVDEIFGIYTFKQLHQMISTVSSQLKPEHSFAKAIKLAFPMGSMTGAPKVMAMRLIERYEKAKRGLYSGAIGYVSPEADFDFNVVIRTILYDSTQKKLSFQVGSAITYDSVPEQEYEECLLKAEGIRRVLGEN
jgi:para-aminobenzoate synthetase component 1